MIKTLPLVSALAAAAALAVAGCGGGSSSGESGAYGPGATAGSTQAASGESGGSRYGGSSPSAASGSAAVSVSSVGDVGKVLVDSQGLTLYYFEEDKGGKSACYGACASAWPPLTTGGAPHAMSGAQSGKLGTTPRRDGTTQVTYTGRPLYTYVANKKPGEDNGTDVHSFGAAWYPLHPNGEKAGE